MVCKMVNGRIADMQNKTLKQIEELNDWANTAYDKYLNPILILVNDHRNQIRQIESGELEESIVPISTKKGKQEYIEKTEKEIAEIKKARQDYIKISIHLTSSSDEDKLSLTKDWVNYVQLLNLIQQTQIELYSSISIESDMDEQERNELENDQLKSDRKLNEYVIAKKELENKFANLKVSLSKK